VVGELDLDRAVVEEFGGPFAIDLVAFVASDPMKADRVACVFDFVTGLRGAKGDFASLCSDRQPRRPAEIEVSPVPEVDLDDPPTADQSAVRRGLLAQASGSFGSRARRPRNLVRSWPATVLIQPKASSIRLRIRWLRA